MAKDSDIPTVDLREYLSTLWLRKVWVIACVAVAMGAALALTLRQTPLYFSTAQVQVKPVIVPGAQSPSGGMVQFFNIDTEQQIAESGTVAEVAADNLDLEGSYFLRNIAVSVEPKTEILQFRFADPTPEAAQRAAQGMAEAYLEYRRTQALDQISTAGQTLQQQLLHLRSNLSRVRDRLPTESDEGIRAALQEKARYFVTQISILQSQLATLNPSASLDVGAIVQPAIAPSRPSFPSYTKNLTIALVLGLTVGIALAFIRERLDDRIRGREDLEERSGVPTLAVIPKVRSWREARRAMLVSLEDPHSIAAEAYRTLRTSVLFAASQRDIKALLITSANPQEGKTATTANLAIALEQAGKKVVAVSADLRRPRLEKFFGQSSRRGLTNVLAGEARVESILGTVPGTGLQLLASGPVPGNPTELLASEAMEKLIAELRQVADFILLDSAPVLAAADSLTLANMVDGVLLVADGGKTRAGAVSLAVEQLARVDAPMMGSVLNKLDPARSRSYQPAYIQYGPEQESTRGGRLRERLGRLESVFRRA
jgi:capsular exopolysaccharide synthesis family protein